MSKNVFYIKKKNLQRFTFDDLLALFKEHDELRVVRSNKDIVCLTKQSGKFHRLGEVEYLNLNYCEYFKGSYFGDEPCKKGQRYYMSNNSEMFHPSESELAVVAFQQRASQNDGGFRTCGMGRSLDEIKATNDLLINLKESRVLALSMIHHHPAVQMYPNDETDHVSISSNGSD